MDTNKPGKGQQGNMKTKANGGGSQVIVQNKQIQQQQQQQQQQQKKGNQKKGGNGKQKGGVRLDGEVEDKYNIQNEQNMKWQCPKCMYVNDHNSDECQKCIHLQKLKSEQKQSQENQ